MKRLLDYDAQTKTSTFHHYDDLTDTTYIEEVQDVESILNQNKAIQNMHDGGGRGLSEYSRKGIKESWWHVAKVPNIVIHKWLVEEGVNFYKKEDWPRVKKLLNNSDYAYLRTGVGRI